MEAFTTSQPRGMVPAGSSPKLENFLGGATAATHDNHHYHRHDREAMALSLDSIYYHQHNSNNNNVSHHPSHLEIFQHQHPAYFSSTHSQAALFQAAPAGEDDHHHHHGPRENGADCGAHHLSNWVSTNHHHHHQGHQVVEHAMVTSENLIEGSSSTMGCGGDLQSLTLSMSPGSQSSCVTANALTAGNNNNGDGYGVVATVEAGCNANNTSKKRGAAGGAKLGGAKQPVHRKSIDTFGQRTSQYRGVTKHRWTGRYEAHLWDNSCKKEGQTRKGRQVYLGGYDMEEKAARAYDLAALKYWGPSTHINFPIESYKEEVEDMKNMTRQEYVAHLRRKSSGFSRGASMYRGVTRHHQHGRWQARIGRVAGNKDLYLGTFSTQEEAAEAYDIAAIKFRGINAVTNFDISRYDVEKIMNSNTLLAGEQAKRVKALEAPPQIIQPAVHDHQTINNNSPVNLTPSSASSDWKMVFCGDYPHQHEQQQQQQLEALDNNHPTQKETDMAGNRSSNFSVTLQDLVGMENTLNSAANHQQQMGLIDQSNNKQQQEVGSRHHVQTLFSNASSLVTSLNSSREVSPADHRSGAPSPNHQHNSNNSNDVDAIMLPRSSPIAWIPSAAAAISMPHLPVFAAWGDA